jgi:hypothetical protein
MVQNYERGCYKMNKKPALVGSMSDDKESIGEKN